MKFELSSLQTFADDLEQSLDDFMQGSQRSDEMSSLDEVAPTKLLNIMSLDDLLPANDNLIEEVCWITYMVEYL